MHVKLYGVFIMSMSVALTGCGWVDKKLDDTEKMLNKKQNCQTESQVSGQGYVTEQHYRCTGAACREYGCGR